MNSAAIQDHVAAWVRSQSFTAPYGVIESQGRSLSGRSYRSVTFGRARTLDASVLIFSPNYILVKTSSHGDRVCRSLPDLMNFLNTL